MKFKDLKTGGLYMYHTTTPEQCTYYNDTNADKLVVLSTVPYRCHNYRSPWMTGQLPHSSSISAKYYDFSKHTKGYTKYILVGVLNWTPYNKEQGGTKIKDIRLVLPGFIRMVWADFQVDIITRGKAKEKQDGIREQQKVQNKQVWTELHDVLQSHSGSNPCMSLINELVWARDRGYATIKMTVADAQILIDLLGTLMHDNSAKRNCGL